MISERRPARRRRSTRILYSTDDIVGPWGVDRANTFSRVCCKNKCSLLYTEYSCLSPHMSQDLAPKPYPFPYVIILRQILVISKGCLKWLPRSVEKISGHRTDLGRPPKKGKRQLAGRQRVNLVRSRNKSCIRPTDH